MTNSNLINEMEENLEIKLFNWQHEVLLKLEDQNDGVIVRVPRGYGKTTLAVVYAYMMAKTYDNINVGIFTHNSSSAGYIGRKISKMRTGFGDNIHGESRHRLGNGSVIHIGYGHQFRGLSLNILILDDHAQIKDEYVIGTLPCLRPSLTPKKLFSLSTPMLRRIPPYVGVFTNMNGHFYDTWNGLYLETYHYNGYLPLPGFNEHRLQRRMMLDPIGFRNDMLAEWI